MPCRMRNVFSLQKVKAMDEEQDDGPRIAIVSAIEGETERLLIERVRQRAGARIVIGSGQEIGASRQKLDYILVVGSIADRDERRRLVAACREQKESKALKTALVVTGARDDKEALDTLREVRHLCDGVIRIGPQVLDKALVHEVLAMGLRPLLDPCLFLDLPAVDFGDVLHVACRKAEMRLGFGTIDEALQMLVDQDWRIEDADSGIVILSWPQNESLSHMAALLDDLERRMDEDSLLLFSFAPKDRDPQGPDAILLVSRHPDGA